MTNKTLSNWIIATLALAMFTIVFEGEMEFATSEMLYTVAGVGYYIFGIWAAVRLRR